MINFDSTQHRGNQQKIRNITSQINKYFHFSFVCIMMYLGVK